MLFRLRTMPFLPVGLDRRVLVALGAQRVREHVVAFVALVGQQLVAGRRA